MVLRIFTVFIFGVHKCHIADYEAENCGIQEYCILCVKSNLTANALTLPEHLWYRCCCVMLSYMYIKINRPSTPTIQILSELHKFYTITVFY